MDILLARLNNWVNAKGYNLGQFARLVLSYNFKSIGATEIMKILNVFLSCYSLLGSIFSTLGKERKIKNRKLSDRKLLFEASGGFTVTVL